MKKDKVIEKEILERYEALGGLVRDGQMVNKDKESRAREYIKSRTKIIDQISEGARTLKDAKYGRFIIQTNLVQFYLAKLIYLRSFDQSNELESRLEGLTMGPLIGYLTVCAHTRLDLKLVNDLKKYKKRRDAVAHKMFTVKKLTPKECELATKQGVKIIKYLEESLKQKSYMIKESDKLSDFPNQFNKLAKEVAILRNKVSKIEKTAKKTKKNK